jgi:hypothetical protein
MNIKHVKFQIFTAASMKMTAVRDMTSCCLVELYRRFRGTIASIMKVIMEAVRTSETSVHFYEATRSHIPQNYHLNIGYVNVGYRFYIFILTFSFESCVHFRARVNSW